MGVGDIVYNAAGAAAATTSASGFDLRISGNTTGTTALVSSGTLTLAGGTNITLSQNGNAITIVGANTGTLQHWYPGYALNQSFSWGNGVPQFFPVTVANYFTATRAHVAISFSLSSSSNSSHAGTISFGLGIYTDNAGTLSSASSGGRTINWTDTAGQSSASLQSNKIISIPINVNMTPGVYYIGQWSSTATANANWATIRNMGAGMLNYNGSFAGAATASSAAALGFGHWSAQAALPGTVSFQQLSANSPQDALMWAVTLMATTYP